VAVGCVVRSAAVVHPVGKARRPAAAGKGLNRTQVIECRLDCHTVIGAGLV
jgi:hypothetical protein